jgi:hypothetical protein
MKRDRLPFGRVSSLVRVLIAESHGPEGSAFSPERN